MNFGGQSDAGCARKCAKHRAVTTIRFARRLSQAFLAASLVMGLFVGLVLLLGSTDEIDGSGTNLKISRRNKRESSLPSGRHEWALARYGFPSAFDDSLYERRLGEDLCPPRRLHLTQATNVRPDDHTVDMILSFTLPYSSCRNVRATVEYGRREYPKGTTTSAEVLNFTYDASQVVPDLDHFQSDWIYHVTLPNLHAGLQVYWYQIYIHSTPESRHLAPASQKMDTQNWAANPVRDGFVRNPNKPGPGRLLGQSQRYTLRTPPLTTTQPTSLALVGDLGQTEYSSKTMNHIMTATQPESGSKIPVSALIIAGDLSYANGDPRRWTTWMELMEPLLRSTPLFSVPGNHDIECDSSTHQIYEQYESYFRNPNRIARDDRLPIQDDYLKTLRNCLWPSQFLGRYDYGNAFWSVQHGMVHIIALNSYTETSPGSPQNTWLENELQSVDRSIIPWLLVVFHCPLHTTYTGHVGESQARLMLENMEPMFVEYRVNIVVSGHDHAYLRTKSMIGTEVDASGKGPIYFILGSGGKLEEKGEGYINPDAPEDWVAKREILEYGFGHLRVSNATHAHFRWVRDGTTTEGIRDSVWLENQYFL